MKPINLKITMATFLLRVHPDVMQVDRHSMKEVDQSIKDHNENALKTLNAYLDVASAGCNGEYTSDMLSTREFPLEFYIPTTKKVQRSQRKIKTATYAEFVHVHGNMYTRIFHPVKLSDKLIETSHQALMNPRTTNVAAVHWRQDTNTVLRDLFFQADIPVLSAHPNGELIPWDEEVVRQVEAEAIFSSNETFEKKFRSMLVRERDVVFKFTTGYEADVEKHQVLLSLMRRIHVDVLPEGERQAAFSWMGDTLLRNFMDLRLANPVWNRAVVILSDVEDTLQVLSDENDDGCQVAFVIGFTHDVDRLVEFLTDEIDKLEVALDAAFAPDPTRRRQKRKGIQPVPKRLY
ncbi:hypothetical protein H310_13134 [Aphanomyces invadans]|uniref:DUF4460 domain-containing protein n=1 Tax=Aphanomyces invadans TaxID=157072 RepID=A0A024TEW3_9STRA|nr:hypothetical protein H310_13134 [Aphanomyces invadans]ETV92700.1 hypothetical protein H310_13134 [Aphanomyces invadans]|eukprot:XP_008878736.1 hypothetical protein H310_13134 [Aphanomyces invadans]